MTRLSAAVLAPHTGTLFTVRGWWVPDEPSGDAGGPALGVSLTLTDVEQGPVDDRFDQFTLMFEGSADRPLDQGTYVVDHPAAPVDTLFLVPVAESAGTRHYAACLSVRTEGSHSPDDERTST